MTNKDKKQHKDKKHKKKHHKEKKRKERRPTDSPSPGSEEHMPAQPAADRLPAALDILFSSRSREPAAPLMTELPQELEGQQVEFTCPLDLKEARQGDEEVWVIRLPRKVPVSALDGRTLHLPREPPEARHLRPLAELLADPTIDLLEHVKAHVRPQVIGHMRLGYNDGMDFDASHFRELLQEDEMVVKRLRVLGPSGGEAVRCSKVARLLSLSEDAFTDTRLLLRTMMDEDPHLLRHLGMDGELGPRKFRKRIAGWRVLGKRPRQQGIWEDQQQGSGSGDEADDESGGSGSASDEEFEEVVFGENDGDRAPFSDEEGGSSEDSGSSDSRDFANVDRVSDSLEGQQPAGGQDSDSDAQGGGSSDEVDWDQRFYSSDSSTDSEREEEWLERQRLQEVQWIERKPPAQRDLFDVLHAHFSLKDFLLSLPVLPEVEALQAVLWPLQPPEQQDDMEQQDHMEEEQQQQQQQDMLQQQQYWQQEGVDEGDLPYVYTQPDPFQQDGGYISDSDTPSSPQQPGQWQQQAEQEPQATPSVVIIDSDDPAAGETPDSARGAAADDSDAPEDYSPRSDYSPAAAATDTAGDFDSAAAAAAGDAGVFDGAMDWSGLPPGYGLDEDGVPPPLPIWQLVQLGYVEENRLQVVSQYCPQMLQFMRNYSTLIRVDWIDVCAQVDLDRMTDQQVDLLLRLLELRRNETTPHVDGEDMQARLLMPRKLDSRPHFTHTDQGYAPYQVADEPPALSISRRDALALDAEWADMLVARGAGRLGTLTDMEQLRARGFAWDSDPEEEQREGLHIQLPNGRSMHIPSGL